MNETVQKELRHLFLREFVKELISHAKPAELPEEPKKTDSLLEKSPQIKSQQPHEVERLVPIKKYSPNLIPRSPLPNHKIQKNNFSPQGYLKSMSDTSQANLQGEGMALGKLSQVLADPAVQNIECPGPNKRILVRKNNTIQSTQITLSEDEIKNVVKDFSEKTRIPVTEGLFKAVYGNLIISAVSSGFLGTKFIIQKRNLQSF